MRALNHPPQQIPVNADTLTPNVARWNAMGQEWRQALSALRRTTSRTRPEAMANRRCFKRTALSLSAAPRSRARLFASSPTTPSQKRSPMRPCVLSASRCDSVAVPRAKRAGRDRSADNIVTAYIRGGHMSRVFCLSKRRRAAIPWRRYQPSIWRSDPQPIGASRSARFMLCKPRTATAAPPARASGPG